MVNDTISRTNLGILIFDDNVHKFGSMFLPDFRGNSADTTSLLLCLPILRQVDHTLRSFWVNIHRRGTIAMNKLFIEMLEPPLKS